MRLKQQDLESITGRTQTAAQARWFRDHFGVALPCDAGGPIITHAAFEKLVERKCGLEPAVKPRPEVRMVK
jgi:hypothetical protein